MFVLLPINIVKASEYPEITQDAEIKYKWYKEVITGDYYPKKDIKEGDLVDENNIKYGKVNEFYDSEYCELSEENYELEKKLMNVYKTIREVRYILLEKFEYKDNIKIYDYNKEIKFEIISNENNSLLIDLKKDYMSENLLFIIDDAQNYKISFYMDKNLINYIISKEITEERTFTPDKTWITPRTSYVNYYTESNLKNSDFTTKIKQYYKCRYREIYIYKYKIEKEYYDNDYHSHIEGYIKDYNDYKIFYKGIPITNTIEITKEKVIKEPKYIYPEKENTKKENDSSKIENTCLPQTKIEVQKEFVEKEIFKIPKHTYIIIIILVITIIILTIKIIKICRSKKMTSIVE